MGRKTEEWKYYKQVKAGGHNYRWTLLYFGNIKLFRKFSNLNKCKEKRTLKNVNFKIRELDQEIEGRYRRKKRKISLKCEKKREKRKGFFSWNLFKSLFMCKIISSTELLLIICISSLWWKRWKRVAHEFHFCSSLSFS